MKHLRIVSVIAVMMLIMTAFGAVMMAVDSSAATETVKGSVTVDSGGSVSKTLSGSKITASTKSAVQSQSDNGVAPTITYSVDYNLVSTNSSKSITPEVTFSGTAPTSSGTYVKIVTVSLGSTTNASQYGQCEFQLTVTVNKNKETYVVSFSTDNGTFCTSKSVQEGSSITLPSTSKSGYTFAGWYTAASGGTYVGGSGSSYTPTSSITLYARWTPNVVTYTVTFDGNGGTSPSAQAAESGKSVTLPSASLYGYSFDGWYTSASGGTFVGTTGSTYTPSGNITLYAHWTKLTVSMSSISGTADIVVGSSATYTFTGTAGCSVSISGATWLTATSSGSTYYLTGVPTVAGVYYVTVTLSKSGYTSATDSISVKAVEQLTFLSVPTAGMIVNG